MPIKTAKVENTESSLYKLWTWDDYDVSVGSSVATDEPHWWEMLEMGEAMHVRGRGIYGTSLYFRLLCCEPKTALNLVFKKLQ